MHQKLSADAYKSLSEKTGKVKDDAFFTILSLHEISLSPEEQSKLKKQFSKAGKIEYLTALQTLQIDLDSAVINEEKWITLNPNDKPVTSKEAAASIAPSKAISHLSRMNLDNFDKKSVTR